MKDTIAKLSIPMCPGLPTKEKDRDEAEKALSGYMGDALPPTGPSRGADLECFLRLRNIQDACELVNAGMYDCILSCHVDLEYLRGYVEICVYIYIYICMYVWWL